jgi:hypothetical protein
MIQYAATIGAYLAGMGYWMPRMPGHDADGPFRVAKATS